MAKWMLIVVLTLSFASPALAADFAKVVFFGDSLSDPGNHFVAFGTTSQPPFEPVPDHSYAVGGHHFTNGATWAERLATDLGVPTSGGPALAVPGLFTNYAVGRARAREGAVVFPHYDLSTQVGRFLSDFGGQAAPENLYVVWIGSNDLGDALNALFVDPTGATSAGIIQAAIAAVAGNIQQLAATGARTFLVPGLPNPAVTPVVRALENPIVTAAATQLAALYNGALEQVLGQLGPAFPEAQFVHLDIDALFAAVLASPEAFGLTNVSEPCLTFGVVAHAYCATPQGYLFWDAFHPTKTGHAIVTEAALQALGAQ